MTNEIKVCMGSACFAKGNQENLEYIKNYIEDNGLSTEISIIGDLCANRCSDGPRIIVDGIEYANVTKEKLQEIMNNIKTVG